MAFGDVDGDGDEELFTAFKRSTGEAYVYRSDSGANIGSSIYKSRSGDNWTVRALALGDVDKDGRAELFAALERSDGTAWLYRSDTGTGIGSVIY